MDDDSVEEEITRTKFDNLPNYFLDLTPSRNKFERLLISLPESPDKTLALTLPSPKKSVFDRLIQDTNRRTETQVKVKDYRLMLEQEYENSFLSPVRLSKEAENKLLDRLISDTERRKQNFIELEKRKQSLSPVSVSHVKWPAEKTEVIVNRLHSDRRDEYRRREQAQVSKIKSEIGKLEIIREKNHPKRKLDEERIKKISVKSPKCRHSEEKSEDKRKRTWKETLTTVNRLHKSSSFKFDQLTTVFKSSKTSIESFEPPNKPKVL